MSVKTRTAQKAGLGSSAAILTAAKLASFLISMAAGMLMARFRTLTEYGTYSQILLVTTLTNSLLTLGLPNSLNYFFTRADTREEQKDFLSVYYTVSTILSVIIGGVLLAGLPLIISYFNNPGLRDYAYFLALYPWTCIIVGSVENLLVASRKNLLLIIYTLSRSVLSLGTILLVKVMSWDFGVFMLLLIATEIASAVAVYIIASDLIGGLRFSLDRKLIRTIFAYSIPIGLSAVVGTLNIELDKLLIGRMFSTEDLAVYTYASRELPVRIISEAFTAVLLPHFARMMKRNMSDEAVKLWKHAIFPSLAVIALVSAGCIAFAPEVLELLYSDKYLAGVTVFRIYCVELLLRCTYFGIMLNTTGHTKFILYSSVASLVLNCCLNILFYRWFGFIGPAIATLVSVTIINIGQLVFSSHILKIPFSRIFPWKMCGGILLLNAAFAGVFLAVRYFVPLEQYLGRIGEAVALGVVWAVVYLLILLRPLLRHWRALNSADSLIPAEEPVPATAAEAAE